MARITKQSQIDELLMKVAALEARLTTAGDMHRAQRARIGELEAAINTRGVKPAVVASAPVAPIVTRFTRRDGVVCERTRTGNRAVVRELRTSCAVPGIEELES